MHPDRFQRPYSYIKSYARRALYFYFDQIQIVGYDEHVPDEGALFFAANHQNTFLDPIIISAFSKINRQPSFITRSDVFNKRTDAFFRVVKMVPIYRQRDGGSDAIRRNEEMFKVYVDRLKYEESMVIFAEGDHGRDRRVRPIKKGLPRIAFQTLEETNFEVPFKVVPVGLYYRDHDKYHTDMLAIYGPPLDVHDYVATYKENKNRGIIALRNDLQPAMEALTIHIKKDHYDLIESLRQIMGGDAARHLKKRPGDLYEQFLAEKELIAQLEAAAAAEYPDFASLAEEVPTYMAQLQAAKLRDHVVAQAPHDVVSLLAQGAYVVLLFPGFLYSFLNHLPIYLILSSLPGRLLKDSVFFASIRYAGGLLVVPLLYLLQALLVGIFAGPLWALGYLVTLLPLGLMAKQYRDRAVKFFSRVRFMQRWWKGDRALKAMRDGIKEKTLRILGKDWTPNVQVEPDVNAQHTPERAQQQVSNDPTQG